MASKKAMTSYNSRHWLISELESVRRICGALVGPSRQVKMISHGVVDFDYPEEEQTLHERKVRFTDLDQTDKEPVLDKEGQLENTKRNASDIIDDEDDNSNVSHQSKRVKLNESLL